MEIKDNKIKEFISYSQSKKLGTEISKNVWKNAIKDFSYKNKNSSLRGYAINNK